MGRRVAGVMLRAAWKGIFVGSIAAGLFFLACCVVGGAYGIGVGALGSPLAALPAGLFAFLWALRPEASGKD